jgi:signal peptidase I
MGLKIRHLFLAVLGLAAAGAAWFFLAPGPLGGSTSYVVTQGDSMQPRFSSGDLVLLRDSSGYRVGDIAAYRSQKLHTIVLHRIVAIDGGRYVFKGDHNSWRDPEHPTRSQLVGTLWLRVPGFGGALKRAGTPPVVAMLIGIAALLLLGGTGVARRRRRRLGREPSPRPRVRPAAQGVRVALFGASIVLVAMLALAAAAFTRPTKASAATTVSYSQHGAFSYSAVATSGAVYPTGHVGTGETVFARLVHRVRISFVYTFRSDAPQALAGRASLTAVLSGSTGWRRTIVLQPPTAFSGDRVVLTGRVALDPLERLLKRVEAATGDAAGVTYTLTIAPRVDLSGLVAAKRVTPSFSPHLDFAFDQFALRPVLTVTGSSLASPANALRPSQSGAVDVSRTKPRTISFRAFDLSVSTARKAAVIGGGTALAVILVCVLLLLRGRRADEPDRIQALYGRRLVPISRSERRDYDEVVEVTSMETLVRLAERYDRMILHEEGDDGHSYRLADDGVLYVYLVGDADVPVEEADSEETPQIELSLLRAATRG